MASGNGFYLALVEKLPHLPDESDCACAARAYANNPNDSTLAQALSACSGLTRDEVVGIATRTVIWTTDEFWGTEDEYETECGRRRNEFVRQVTSLSQQRLSRATQEYRRDLAA